MTGNEPSKVDFWANDLLARKADAEFLKVFLVQRALERKEAGQSASYVLNIDARWGQGKSFFLAGFAQMLREDGYLVAEVNAWRDDHADDPLLSVMDAIDSAVAPLVKREKRTRELWNKAKQSGGAVAVAAIKGLSVQAAKVAIGPGVGEIATILEADVDSTKVADDLAKALGEAIGEQGKALLASFREGKRTISQFKEAVERFLSAAEQKSQAMPLFVLIDELDRCRPPFAIAMLERMKHLFEINNVVFVVATDTEQLSCSIGAVYGNDFDSKAYLSRFFNRTYHFEQVNRRTFVAKLSAGNPLDKAIISIPPNTNIDTYLADAFDFVALPLRDIEQVYDIIRTFVTTWTMRCKIELAALIPVAIAHQQKLATTQVQMLGKDITSLAKRLGGGNSKWGAEFRAADFRSSQEYTDGIGIMNELFSRAVQPLSEINHEVTSAYSRWAAHRLGEEYALLHQNSHFPDNPPYSIIRAYPEMVRSAGRLTMAKIQA